MSRKPSHKDQRIAQLEAELRRYRSGVEVDNGKAYVIEANEFIRLRGSAEEAGRLQARITELESVAVGVEALLSGAKLEVLRDLWAHLGIKPAKPSVVTIDIDDVPSVGLMRDPERGGYFIPDATMASAMRSWEQRHPWFGVTATPSLFRQAAAYVAAQHQLPAGTSEEARFAAVEAALEETVRLDYERMADAFQRGCSCGALMSTEHLRDCPRAPRPTAER